MPVGSRVNAPGLSVELLEKKERQLRQRWRWNRRNKQWSAHRPRDHLDFDGLDLLPFQASDRSLIAPERSRVDARLRGEATAPVSTSEDISEDLSDDDPLSRRSSLKTAEKYRKHLAPTGQALASWRYRAVKGQLRAEPKVGTRSLRACIKSLERDLASPSSAPKGGDPSLWRAGRRRNRRRLEDALSPPSQGVAANQRETRDRSHLPLALDQLKRVQEYRRRRQDITSRRASTPIANDSKSTPDRSPSSPASSTQQPRSNTLAEMNVVRTPVTKAIQVAVYPPEQPKQGLVQVATAQGLLADASTYPLPWDSWDSPDGNSGDAALECNLNCITETGDIRPGWSGLLAAASASRAPPQCVTVGTSGAPTLLLFWAYIAGTRVKVLVDSGCSTNIIANKTVNRIPSLSPRPHERAMRVRVANGMTYDVNTCVRPRLQAETTKGSYVQQLELRVMPIDLSVDVILGGPWLASHSPVTLDYARWGSIRFGRGSKKVVITGCSPGAPDPSRPKDNSMGLVQGVLLDPKRTRKDLRALQAKEENAFVVYLAPDGTFGAEACEGDEPDSVLNAAFEYSDSDPASPPGTGNPTNHTSSSHSKERGIPTLSQLSTSESESGPEDAEQLREAVGRGSSSSEEDHLNEVYAVVDSSRPPTFDAAALEGASGPCQGDKPPSNDLHLGHFQSRREALGAFALLPEHVRDQAIDDHAQGKPPTWYAQAAAALERGRQMLTTRRPRRKRVRWRDQKNVCADRQTSPPAEPKLVAAVTDDSELLQGPESKPTTPKAVEDEVDESVTQEIGQQLRDLEEEFKDVICTELPESVQSREYKASIRLRPDWNGQPLHRRGYKLSQEELRQLRLQLDELLAKGYIRPSASPWGCPVLMVPKPGNPKELRLVIDYRQINEITIKDKYPLPDVQCLLDDMQGATVFSTADALWGFWQVPMEELDVEKTAMTTHFGAYEWLVMPMGLSNSPSTWQRMMNQYLGHLPFCRVFVDAIMIFSATPQEHVDHVRQVLAACRLHKVYLKKSKLKLCMRAVRFLGHVIDKNGSRPQQDKVASVRDWPDLETVTHVRQFLGMCGFYRRYIQSFAHIAHPLTHLTKTGVNWTWGTVEKEAFHRLKRALISAPTLALPDQRAAADGSRPFCVQTDASAVALGGVLMQDLGRGLQPLAFESRQFSSAEQNYHAGERELCAIHHCTTVTWRHYLIFTNFKLMGDHKPLQWLFAPARELSRRQARWYEDLVEVGVHQMEHVPGRCLVVPDAQSRRPDYKQSSAREGLKEKGLVDRATDGPRQDSTEAMKGNEPGNPEPTSVLDAMFEYSDSEDDSVPPVSPPLIVGELTQINGLTWAETPDLWEDAAETLLSAEQALQRATLAAPITRSQARQHESKEQQLSPAPTRPPVEIRDDSPKPTTPSRNYENVVDRQDWKLVKEEFEKIVQQYGQFDVDACCDSMGVNRQVPTYWTDCLKQQWRGKHVWCNPPYTKDNDLIEKILRHFLAEWRADPENTSAMFLLPDYDASWRTLVQPKYGLHVVKVFDLKDSKGRPTRLFESPDGGRPSLRWPVLLVWAPAAGRTRPRTQNPRARAPTVTPELVTSGPAAKARVAATPLKACQFVKALRAEYDRSPYLTMLREELLAAPHQRTDTFRMVDDMIWRVADGRYQLVLSSDSPLRELVLREAHESPAAGHTGRDKTFDRVVRRFWWPRMSKDVSDWTRSCLICQQTRPRNSYPDGQLNPLLIPVRLWQVVSIDFVTGLPRTERGYDAFATFTDKLSKMVHVVPMLYSDSSAEQVARMYFDHVWRLHGAPMKIVCDRDSRFRDQFHQELHRLMGVQVASTTPYHPQGDGQAEHTNHTVERMLRAYVDANQLDWDLWCTPVEYAINDSRSAVTGFTPFELCYGHAPASQLDFFVEAALAARRGRAKGGRGDAVKKGTAHETARQFVHQLHAAREKLLVAQQQQMAQYDARHKARQYAVGDMVWVDATHLTQPGDRGLHKKLLKKRLGPMKVIAAFHSDRQMELAPEDRGAPVAYRLELPPQWKVHDVFTVDRLTPVESASEKFADRSVEVPPPPVDVSGRKETAVECVERSRTRKRNGRTWTEYNVKWVGMPRSQNEWKTREDLEFDGEGRKGIPNRALQEFEKIERKKKEREKGRVQRRREEAAAVLWLTTPEELQYNDMPWVPAENHDEESGIFAYVSTTCFMPAGGPGRGAAQLRPPSQHPSRMLVLFCGTGSVEQQFSKQFPGCEVVTVDILPRWGPVHCEDILSWNYQQYKPRHFDVIWASPPCTEYSQAKTVGVRDLRAADRRVRRTLEIIKYLQPDFYFIENPRGRAPYGLHTRRCMQGLPPPHLATYCKYGMPYKKPTHFWTNAPLDAPLKVCDVDEPCEFKRQHGRHEKMAQSGTSRRTSGESREGMGAGWHVYGIPKTLLKQLFRCLPLNRPLTAIEEVCEFLSCVLWREELMEDPVATETLTYVEDDKEEPVILPKMHIPLATPADTDSSEWDIAEFESDRSAA